jgi:sugar-specific transcriptional regulator TrmB
MKEVLNNLGFTNNEATVYLALLKLGLSTANGISKEVKLHRTNIYDALNKLIGKGFISYITKNKVKYFQPSNPKNIKLWLNEKQKQFDDFLPQLSLLYNQKTRKSYAEICEGVKAFMSILYNFLEYKQPILVYGIPKIAPKMVKNYIGHFHNVRIPKRIVMKHIYNFENKERIEYLNKLPYTEAKALPVKYNSNVSTNICGDEVVLAIWSETPKIIRIVNQDISDAYRNYFEILWKRAR